MKLEKLLYALVLAAGGCVESTQVREQPGQMNDEQSYRAGYFFTRQRDAEGDCLGYVYTISNGVLSFGGKEAYYMPSNGAIEMMFRAEKPGEVFIQGIAADGRVLWTDGYHRDAKVTQRKIK